MANFSKTKYEADDGTIHPLRLTTGFAAVAGTEPAGDMSSKIPAKVTKGNREFGLRPRGVRLSRLIGAAPNAFSRSAFLPLRSIADAANAAYVEGETVSVNGVTWTIASFVPEDYK